jgi:hypothetical protein
MSNKMWEGTVEHAKTCVLSGKLYVYYADEKQNIGVIFNNIFQLMGLIAEGSYMSVDSLSDNEKVSDISPGCLFSFVVCLGCSSFCYPCFLTLLRF